MTTATSFSKKQWELKGGNSLLHQLNMEVRDEAFTLIITGAPSMCCLDLYLTSVLEILDPSSRFFMRKPPMAVSSTSCFSLRGTRLRHVGYHVAKIIKVSEVLRTSMFFTK